MNLNILPTESELSEARMMVAPAVVADVAARLQAGRSLAPLVAEGKLSQWQADKLRRQLIDGWRSGLTVAEPATWAVLELARLEHMASEAMEAWEDSKPSDLEDEDDSGSRKRRRASGDPAYLKIAMASSRERRKLLGIDAPERREIVIRERPGTLTAEILDADYTEHHEGDSGQTA